MVNRQIKRTKTTLLQSLKSPSMSTLEKKNDLLPHNKSV